MHKIVIKATLSVGHHDNEVIAVVNEVCSAFLDRSFVVGPLPSGPDPVDSTIYAYALEEFQGGVMIEIPGIAIGALRTWVPPAKIVRVS
jgi:hypothetical protein